MGRIRTRRRAPAAGIPRTSPAASLRPGTAEATTRRPPWTTMGRASRRCSTKWRSTCTWPCESAAASASTSRASASWATRSVVSSGTWTCAGSAPSRRPRASSSRACACSKPPTRACGGTGGTRTSWTMTSSSWSRSGSASRSPSRSACAMPSTSRRRTRRERKTGGYPCWTTSTTRRSTSSASTSRVALSPSAEPSCATWT
mmetsp:Transcript_17294/g.65905  ORF Transcript_17294/g.65905 Transcript_17294/m.65905 type:complete len:202 (+) Transcript_17294:203-808(+)